MEKKPSDLDQDQDNANNNMPESKTPRLRRLISGQPKDDQDEEEKDADTATTESPLLEQVKEEEEEEETENNDEKNEEEIPPSPQIQQTLETICPDIDGFIVTTLPTLKIKEPSSDSVVGGGEEGGEEAGDADKDEDKDADKDEDKDADKVTVEIPETVSKFLELFEEELAKYESNEYKGRWNRPMEEDDGVFLGALNRLSKLTHAVDELRSDPVHSLLINRLAGVHQRAMSYLEDEFRILLEDTRMNDDPRKKTDANSNDSVKCKSNEPDGGLPVDQSAPEEEDFFLGYSDEVVSNLNRIAKEMIEGGYESECCHVYMILRGHAMDESITKIGFEKISIDEVQKMNWEALEREIPSWIKTVKDCSNIYFSKECKLAESVFAGHPSLASSLFSNLARGVVIRLLNFAEGVAMTKRSAEKLFKFLDMYEALRDNLPPMNGLFVEEYQNELRTETSTARCRIGEAAICIFCDLENSIKSDIGKTPVPGGAVHPLTRYTVNYLKYACEYRATLEQVFKEHSKIERADSMSRPTFDSGENQGSNNNNNSNIQDWENNSPFSNQVMRVMELLDSNLEAKSKLYRDNALGCIFMMNNGRYILQKIKGSTEIHDMTGNTWCRKKSSDLRNYHKSYQRETWSKLLGCLGHEGLQVNGKVLKPVLKERFKSFNSMFDEIHRTQSTWVVKDEQLQSELRVSISAVVIPAYRSFMGRFSQYLDPGRQSEKYIKFQPEDIENCIDELFDGNPASTAKKRT